MLDKHKSRVTSSEMKYQRRIHGKRKAMKYNYWKKLKMGLEVEEIEKRSLKCYDHLIRINNERKQNKYIKLNLRGEEDGEDREMNGNIM